jgi:hypothetical protein
MHIQVPVHQEWAEWIIKLKAKSIKLKAYKIKPLCICKGVLFYNVTNM